MSRAAQRRRVRLTPTRRHVAAIIAIALSTAFVTVMVLAGSLVTASLRASAEQTYAGVDLVASTEEYGAQAPDIPGARDVTPVLTSYAQVTGPDPARPAFVQITGELPASVQPLDLASGRAASAADEVVLDDSTARSLGAEVGDRITIPRDQLAGTDPSAGDPAFTVTGITAPTTAQALGMGMSGLHVSAAAAGLVFGDATQQMTNTWFASVAPGEDASAVAAAASTSGLAVRTGAEAIEDQVQGMMQGFAFLGAILVVFVVIALLTTAVVIANTFTVTLAQQTRSLALLRTLGASRRQVAGIVTRETLLVGLVGSALGTVLGHLFVQAVLLGVWGLGWLPGVLAVPVTVLSIVLPLVVGVVLALVSGVLPARRATRVAPLQALRPEPPAAARRFGVREGIGVVALVLGLGALVGGAALSSSGQAGMGIVLGVIGGIVSFVGLLLLLVALTGPLARAVGAVVGRLGGTPARLAAATTRRHPGRSAATIAALVIGTTLMTMMSVGARTADVSLTRDLADARPIDAVITGAALPADAATRIGDVRGIAATETAARADVDVHAAEDMTLYAASPEQIAAVSNRDDLAPELHDDVIVLGTDRATRFGVSDGQRLELTGADGATVTVTVHVDGNLHLSLTTPATLHALAGDQVQPVVLARFAAPGSPERGDADAMTVAGDVQDVLAQDGFVEAQADFGGVERETYGQVLDVLLGITLALLAVAVLVALVGVANTLSLGVIERSGENALLRALGTTRGQMRSMLGWEGVLLAFIGAVLGIVLGGVYGVAGIWCILGGAFPVTITIPWVQIAAVLVLAVLAGWAASVLPGRRAARTAPAQALAAADE